VIRTALLARKHQARPAVLGFESSVSYAALARQAAALQAALPAGDGRPAALLLPDGSGFLAALFAVLQAGGTALPLSTRLQADELASLLRLSPVRVILTSKALLARCNAAAQACPVPPAILCIEDVPPFSGAFPPVCTADPTAPMLLLASSGTTGRAKLVQLSEHNMAFNAAAYLRHMGFEKYRDPDPRYALGTPLYGIYGLLVAFSCVLRGFPMLPMAEDFSLDMLYRGAEALRISHYDGGAIAAVLMDKARGHAIPYDISALRYFGFGGSKIPDGTLERLSADFPGVRFWSGYGMTEASPLIAQPFQALPAEKLGSVGVPLPGVKVLLETETGRTDAPDCPGEIVVQGPNVMLGYYGDEAATREILRDGWLHTGDIGYFDRDGYLYICGRKKSMLLVRGFNVYPEEVEGRLLECPLVADCVVFGAEDQPGTETVCADIVPAAAGVTAEAVQNWCAAHLADYKRPRRIRLTARIEKTSTGKNRRAAEGVKHGADPISGA